MLFKFRSDIAPIRIETGRYESNVDLLTGHAKKEVPQECRICPCCFMGVESEVHFLVECPRYKCLRSTLLIIFKSYCVSSNTPFPEDINVFFNLLMACQDRDVINALADYLWDAFNYRAQLLGNK